MENRRNDTERRNSDDRRRSNRRKSAEARYAAVEICDTNLYAAIVTPGERQAADTVVTRSIEWRKNAATIYSQLGRQELFAAFGELIRDEHLSGAVMRIALGGRHCVTRVLAGTTDYVRRELSHLEERSQLYLTLGPGHKALAGSISAMDARHQHALLAVTNQKTLDALVEMAGSLGVQLEFIEPSLVSLSRVIRPLAAGRDEPVIVIHFDNDLAELGICRQGRLLLDYRPNAIGSADALANLVVLHLSRLQRFCDRYYTFAKEPLRRVVLCGHYESAREALEAFGRRTELEAQLLQPSQIEGDWAYTDGEPGTESVAVLSAALAAGSGAGDIEAPNLMEHVIAQSREPMRHFLYKAAVPFAATLLVAAVLFAVNRRAASENDAVRSEVEALAPIQTRARELELTLRKQSKLVQNYGRLEAQLCNEDWERFASVVGKCMPDDVWLDRVAVRDGNLVTLNGVSYADTGIYEFVHWLEQVPGFGAVALQSTAATNSAAGPATSFDVGLVLANRDGRENKGGSGD